MTFIMAHVLALRTCILAMPDWGTRLSSLRIMSGDERPGKSSHRRFTSLLGRSVRRDGILSGMEAGT